MSDPSVSNLDEFRLKRAAKPGDLNVASCMNCGEEYPWGRRLEHDCARDRSKANHPSTKS